MNEQQAEGLPEAVPARMVNEFVYCPRLFYLEWVQGRFASSDDVEEGRYVHRVVDQPAGGVPTADNPERFTGRRWRSLWLTSTTLRVTGKIDVVEAAGGSVIPVDYKKGAPASDGSMWPSDTVQSALQALLLRDAGFIVKKAEVWYAATRQRVVLPIDEAVLARTAAVLDDLWQVAASDTPPPPLQDSPKCPRCSLVGICLPDEINALRLRVDLRTRPRRLVPDDPASRPVYVQEQGATVGVRGGRLHVVKQGEELASYRLIDVSQLCLQGNVSITAQAMRQLFGRDIPVCWFSYGGWFQGIAHGLPNKHVDLRRAQALASAAVCLPAARAMVEGKIRNSRTLLRRNVRTEPGPVISQLGELAAKSRTAPGAPSLLGVEGTAARLYFTHFTSMLRTDTDVEIGDFDLHGRSRRPPPDPLNALLSFLYALLVKDLTATLVAVGFDPYLGVYHRPRYGRPALALDLVPRQATFARFETARSTSSSLLRFRQAM